MQEIAGQDTFRAADEKQVTELVNEPMFQLESQLVQKLEGILGRSDNLSLNWPWQVSLTM